MAGNGVFVDRDILKSEVYRSLSYLARSVLLDFQSKCVWRKQGAKGNRNWVIWNNGEIIFTYDEAGKRGYSRSGFRDAIDELVQNGFINIKRSGNGRCKGVVSLYSISDRWKSYGTANFIKKQREKDTRCATRKKRVQV